MNLLRIGRQTVNMDQVLTMYDTGDKLTLRFGHGEHSNQHHEVHLSGDEYEAFVRWLDANATNLTPKTEMDEEWEEYKRNVGEMSRERWEAARREHRDVSAMLDSLDPMGEGWKRQMERASRLEVKLGY